jgi:hypothetical protein
MWDKHRYMQRWYHEHKAKGLCVSCGKTKRGTQVFCDRCHQKRLKRQQTRRNGLLSYRTHAQLCISCGDKLLDRQYKWCLACRKKGRRTIAANRKKYLNSKQHRYECRQRLKREVINAYGGKCRCCSITEITMLTIDHLNNDGSQQRKHLGHGFAFYYWLRRNRYPPGFQVLCFNCNLSKHLRGGTCAHQVKD